MAQTICMLDAALGHAAVCVTEVYVDMNGTYNFTDVVWVRDLHTGETNDDVSWCELVQDYLHNEGYAAQHVSAQCGVIYNNWFEEHAQ
jgi:hypothetical protein